MRPRLIFIASVAAVLALGGSGSRGAEEDFLFGRPWAVQDSSEVENQLEGAREAEAARDWNKAAGRLQHVLDYYPGHVVRVGDEAYVGARDHVIERLRAWPAEGLEAYRRLVDGRALDLLRQGLAEKDVKLLDRVWMVFPLCSHAGSAANGAGLLHLSAGRFRRAAERFGALLDREVANDLSRTELRIRLAFALARLGEGDSIVTLLADQRREGPEARISLGGKERSVVSVLDRLRQEGGPGAGKPTGWPHYGGFPAHDVPQGPPVDPGILQWDTTHPDVEIEADWRRLDFQHGDYMRTATGWPSRLARWYPIHPVLAGSLLLIQNGHGIRAYDAFTGEVRWSWFSDYQGNEGRTNFGTVYSASTTDDTVYVNLEIKNPHNPVRSSSRHFRDTPIIYPIPARRLYAFRMRPGGDQAEILWSHEDESIEGWPEREFLRSATVDTPPLVIEDRIYVPMTRFEGNYRAFLCAFDRHTGRLIWKTRLCSGQMEVNLFGRPVKEGAPSTVAFDGRHLYVCTNLGLVACVDSQTSLVRWIRGYPLIPIPGARQWFRAEERKPAWTNAPPILKRDLVLFTPTDSRYLLALFREDGSTRWRFDRGDPDAAGMGWDDVMSELIGADDAHAYVAGTSVYAIDLRSGKLRWKGAFEEGEEATGRGALTKGTLFSATEEALYAFDIRHGRVRWRRTWESVGGPARAGEAGGNLLLRDGLLLVSGRKSVEAYYDWNAVFTRLDEQVAAAPRDAGLRIRAGRIYLRGGRLEQATSCFEEARRLTRAREDEPSKARLAEALRGEHEVRMARVAAALDGGRLERARTLLEAALKGAPDTASRVETRLLLVRLADLRSDDEEAIRQLRALEARDGEARAFPSDGGLKRVGPAALFEAAQRNLDRDRPDQAVLDYQGVIERHPGEPYEEGDSGVLAERRIDQLLEEHGRGVYSTLDREAAKALAAARMGSNESGLLAVARVYPNSTAAPEALVELARRRLAAGDYRRAADLLRERLQRTTTRRADAQALALLLVCHEKRERYGIAHGVLRRLRDRYASVTVEIDGRKMRVEALAEQRLQLEAYRLAAAVSGLPALELPLRPRWRIDDGEDSLTRLLRVTGPVPTGSEGVVFVLSDTILFGRDAGTGRILWRRPVPDARDYGFFADGRLVVHREDAALAIDPVSGQVRWTFEPGQPLRAIVAGEDTVFALLGSYRERNLRTLVALAASGGEVLWKRELEGRYSDALVRTPESVIALSNNPSAIQVFDALTGRQGLEIELGEGLYREPFLLDATRLVVIHGNRELELWDLERKEKAWEYTLPQGRYFRSALALGSHVLLTDMSDTLRLLDGATGREAWASPVPAGRHLSFQGEAGDDDHVYVIHRDDEGRYRASALRRENGRVVWSQPLLESRSAHILPTVTQDHVLYHANSFDLEQNAWSSRTLVLERGTGKVEQTIEVEEVQGRYSYAVLDRGRLGFFSRGRLVLFSSE